MLQLEPINLPKRIASRIVEAPCPVAGLRGHCWLWQGRFRKGYGLIDIDNKSPRNIHIVVYELLVGPRNSTLTFDHLCRVRACCQPLHLEQVTNKVNVLRGNGPAAVNARKTHCKYGHEFTPSNTLVVQSYRKGKLSPQRTCKICNKAKYLKHASIYKRVRIKRNGVKVKVYVKRRQHEGKGSKESSIK